MARSTRGGLSSNKIGQATTCELKLNLPNARGAQCSTVQCLTIRQTYTQQLKKTSSGHAELGCATRASWNWEEVSAENRKVHYVRERT